VTSLTRRQIAGAGLAAQVFGACATQASGEPADIRFRNLETPSESVHAAVASDDGERRLTVRLCRYPDLGLAWVWVHARTPAGFFSYVNHLAPCGTDMTPLSDAAAVYADSARMLVFARTGAAGRPTSARIEGACQAFASAASRFGEGPRRLAVAMEFKPARAYSGLNPGRTEVFGRTQARVVIDGRSVEIEGPAQFHEQRQSAPRFVTPFTYITLWGDQAASTLLATPRRGDGYVLEGEQSFEARIAHLDPPKEDSRRLAVALSDGRSLEGRAQVLARYTLPIAGRTWRGSFVSIDLGGRRLHGNFNDWLPEENFATGARATSQP
jgi:hypothetical protein